MHGAGLLKGELQYYIYSKSQCSSCVDLAVVMSSSKWLQCPELYDGLGTKGKTPVARGVQAIHNKVAEYNELSVEDGNVRYEQCDNLSDQISHVMCH